MYTWWIILILLHNFHVLYTFSNLHSIIISMSITIPNSFFLTIKEYHIKYCIPHSTLTSLNQKHSDTAPKQNRLFIYLNSINIPNVENRLMQILDIMKYCCFLQSFHWEILVRFFSGFKVRISTRKKYFPATLLTSGTVR